MARVHFTRPQYLLLLILTLLSAMQFNRCAMADTWADRLGYPAGSKVLILHANELGMSHETNVAGTKLLESGAVQSGSAMVPAPWFGDLTRWAKSHPDADLGLELTINSEFDHYRWQPVASGGIVPSLVDSDGFFWQLPVQTTSNGTAEDVELELRTQIDRAKAKGLRPTHLLPHLGTLMTRPDLIEIYLRIARDEWIPATIVEITPEFAERFRKEGFPLPDELVGLLADYPLPKLDDFHFVPPSTNYAAKKKAFLTMLKELSPGITQISFRPATESDALARITDDAQQRVWDAELLADEEVREALKAERIVLTNWKEIMQRFEGRPAKRASEPSSK